MVRNCELSENGVKCDDTTDKIIKMECHKKKANSTSYKYSYRVKPMEENITMTEVTRF